MIIHREKPCVNCNGHVFYKYKNGVTQCKPCLNEISKKDRLNHPGRSTKYSRVRRKKLGKEECNKERHAYRTRCPEKFIEWNNRAKEKRNALRDKLLEIYGSVCACCKEVRKQFLVIDHIDGGGNAHRRKIGSRSIYRWLEVNGFPSGFRVLCHNCNFSLGAYGFCPHQNESK